MASQSQRWSGCILGLALGDALGAPVEGKGPAECAEYARRQLTGHTDAELLAATMPADATPEPGFGQYTDDTQLARELLLSYAERGHFDAADYAQRIGELVGTGAAIRPSRVTQEAGLRLHSGVPWENAGLPVPAAGNCAAVRAAPLGLLFSDDLEGLLEAAREQARITNHDPRCAAGAAVIAGAVALLLHAGERKDTLAVEPLLAELAEWVRRIDQSLAFDVYQLSSWVGLSPEAAATFMLKAGFCPGSEREWAGVSSFVVPSVLWSLYSFLRSPDDVRETLRSAIAIGGDVDTTAAMAGAMLGAWKGHEAFPSEWTARLHDQGRFGAAELIALSERCYRVRGAA